MTTDHPNSRHGRFWAYACAQLGGLVSIAANWAHSYVAPHGASKTWEPEPGAVVFSVFWPVAVFFAVEAFARVPWPAGRRFVLIRFAGLLPVAVVAAVVSYLHLSGLLRHYGASPFEANIGPLAIDGLMLIGTGALIATTAVRVTAATPNAATNTAPITAAIVSEADRANTPNTPAPITRPEHPAIEANTHATDRANTAAEHVAERQPITEANVRPIDSARREPIADPIAANLRSIKRKYKDWRTNVPSARQCAAVIGVAPSTGLSYQRRLIDEIATAGAKTEADDDKERSA